MSDASANVTSLEALRQLRAAVSKFDDESRQAITMLALEVRRAIDWLEVDRMQYWPEQVRRAGDKLIEARNALERCQLKYGSEEAPSCYEQKKAFERARRRVRLCDEKLRATKNWIRTIRQEVNEFDGQIAKLSNCLDNDLPRAIAALDHMLQALDRYTGTAGQRTTSPSISEVAEPPPTPEEKGEP